MNIDARFGAILSIVLLLCPERDNLLAEYDAVVNDCIRAVDRFAADPKDRTAENEARKARAKIENVRTKIRQHCLEHGCDPDWIKPLVQPGGGAAMNRSFGS